MDTKLSMRIRRRKNSRFGKGSVSSRLLFGSQLCVVRLCWVCGDGGGGMRASGVVIFPQERISGIPPLHNSDVPSNSSGVCIGTGLRRTSNGFWNWYRKERVNRNSLIGMPSGRNWEGRRRPVANTTTGALRRKTKAAADASGHWQTGRSCCCMSRTTMIRMRWTGMHLRERCVAQ